MSLKLASINIERSKHLDRVIPFLQRYDPDVICVQELLERDIPLFEEIFGVKCIFGPSGFHSADEPETESVMVGTALLSRLPIRSQKIEYYTGSEAQARSNEPQEILTNSKLIICDLEKDDTLFRIATTHFTWSPRGMATDEQRTNMRHLIDILGAMGEFVLCGDFNAPRGGEIFAMLTDVYKDNIPPQYATSIDIDLHRAGRTRPQELADKMVDGLFSTPGYEVADVQLISGVSDHCAVTTTISRRRLTS
ncbi:endonuclease/exonuclease/phosphatase family protein [Candidatus Kaiserbacteria bacterium]|nr:endonuclease/exonuclease/phosphatase family protein [Candidatus Kaiserbacteria bacterium]